MSELHSREMVLDLRGMKLDESVLIYNFDEEKKAIIQKELKGILKNLRNTNNIFNELYIRSRLEA